MRDLIKKVLKEAKDNFDWAEELINSDGVNPKVMEYLKTNYPKRKFDLFGDLIIIDEKPYYLNRDSKKTMLNKIYWEIVDEFQQLDKGVIRRTIRYYINSLI